MLNNTQLSQMDRYFINNNNCKLKQYSGRLPEGIHHQSWSPEHIHVIIITITNRQNTDKQNHTKDKKEEKGIRTQAQLNVVSQTFDNILNITNDKNEIVKIMDISNEWVDMTGLNSSGREFHRQLPLN